MKKIAVFTGTRAEYGLLYWVINALSNNDAVELQLIVGGMHLSPEFGYTIGQVEKDGFDIAAKLEFLLSSDSPVGIAKSMGLALISAADALERLAPDCLVVLGDRFETMAVCQAAMTACIPIAHIHGGEATEGLIDEAVRHSITKMSHLHFTTTEAYRTRVIQLGEDPEKVFNFGAPGIDSINKLDLLSRNQTLDILGFDSSDKYILLTYHPVTLDKTGGADALNSALDVMSEYQEYKMVITYPNADTYGRQLIEIIDEYSSINKERVFIAQSLGQLRYLSVLKHASAVVGNSSSGIIEAPSFNIPTVNIGDRQRGRIASQTVIHCDQSRQSIAGAIAQAFSDSFNEDCKRFDNPYGEGKASELIVEKVIQMSSPDLVLKKFYDLV